MARSYLVKPEMRAIQVLECAAAAASPISLKEISGRVAMPKATVFRYLHTLRACGLIAHDAERDLYRVDAGILSLVQAHGRASRAAAEAAEFAARARKLSGRGRRSAAPCNRACRHFHSRTMVR
jgi:DNA-binding IclR family transcriptional regulator